MQWKDIFYIIFNVKINLKHDGKEATRRYYWELDPIGLLCKGSKV